MRVFARPVFGTCLDTLTCLRDDVGLRPTCLRDLSSHAHMSSQRRVSSPDLSSGSVFATTCDARLRQTWFRDMSLPAHVSSRRRGSSPDLPSGRVFACPRVFATTHAFTRHVFGNCLLAQTWLHHLKCRGKGSALGKCLRTPTLLEPLSSPGMCLQTPTCIRCLRLACVC